MRKPVEDFSNFETCTRCQGLFENGQELCSACGTPTKYMSFKRRAEYEVEQWRRHKAEAAASA